MEAPSAHSRELPIGGLQKLTLVDYPGHTAATVFTLGCNMRCGYCHNPELVLPEQFLPTIAPDDIFGWLATRRGKLDGVAITGGEPTMHDALEPFCHELHDMGFLVKLDSNGTRPDMLERLINDGVVNFVAMDIKGPLNRYSEIAARPIDTDAISRSVRLLIDSGVGHEFRTTIVTSQLAPEDFEQIGKLVRGAKRYALQAFRPGKTLSPQFANEQPYDDVGMRSIQTILNNYVDTCVIH